MTDQSAERIRLPDGTEVEITRRATEPRRESFELEMVVAPAGLATPPHVHPDQTDEFDVVSGSLEVLDGETWRELKAGESLVIPPGRVHTYRNRSGSPATVRNVHDPAGSFQEYIERMGLLSRQGKLENTRSPKALLYLALLWSEHTDSMRFSQPLLRWTIAGMASLARALRLSVPRPR